jgi:imidazolonepropionase-like amidohydrolase
MVEDGRMKILIGALLALAHLTVPAAAFAQTQAQGPAVAFTNVTLVPMDSERLVQGQTVIVRDGRIEAIGATAAMALPADLPQIDGTDRYLMPGLAEMHAHVPPDPKQKQWTRDVLFLYVANGITFARSMLGAPHHLDLRNRAERGELLSPRLLLSGPSFNGNSVASPEAGRKMVAEQKAAGYDFLKIHPGLDRARYDAVADEAHSASIPFAGHVPAAVGLDRALQAGQKTVDHLDQYVAALIPEERRAAAGPDFFGFNLSEYADEARIGGVVRATREAGTWNVPTESLIHHVLLPAPTTGELADREELGYVPPQMRDQWVKSRDGMIAQPSYDADRARHYAGLRMRLIKALHEGGAGLLLGSDAPQIFNVPGFAIHHELRILVEAGLTPFQALATGTRDVGRFLGDQSHGVIAPGARADLILLEANPLADVANLQRRAGVMLGGRWIAEGEIQSGLNALATRFAD